MPVSYTHLVKSRQVIVGNVTVDNMAVEDAGRQLPLVKTKSDTYYEYGKLDLMAGNAGVVSGKEVPIG